MAATSPPPASPPSPTAVTREPDLNDNDDPPPPYPSRPRRPRRSNPMRRQQQQQQAHGHAQFSSAESHTEYLETGEAEPTETTPFLALSEQQRGRRTGRPRSDSHRSTTSAVSVAPSLAHTIASMFQPYDDDEDNAYLCAGSSEDPEDGLGFSPGDLPQSHHAPPRFWSGPGLKTYFHPLTRKVYWRAVFHLYVVNFPYALAAFLYVFVLTVTGTTLLMALPLGALLCFFNLLGARVFARGELALQTKFHTPLAYPMPYPPRPLFTRMQHDSGGAPTPEPSFYRNTYAMFTDVTSYQSLFYFLVIKPSITLLLSLALIVLGVPALVLVLPAPMALRAIRRIGIWQANVAVDGLYLSSR